MPTLDANLNFFDILVSVQKQWFSQQFWLDFRILDLRGKNLRISKSWIGQLVRSYICGCVNCNNNLKPTKFAIKRIFWIKFGDFVKIWILVILWNLESLTLAKSNFESLTLDHKIWILMTKITFFDEFFNFDEKIDENRKFEILNPKIKNWRNHKIWNP